MTLVEETVVPELSPRYPEIHHEILFIVSIIPYIYFFKS